MIYPEGCRQQKMGTELRERGDEKSQKCEKKEEKNVYLGFKQASEESRLQYISRAYIYQIKVEQSPPEQRVKLVSKKLD